MPRLNSRIDGHLIPDSENQFAIGTETAQNAQLVSASKFLSENSIMLCSVKSRILSLSVALFVALSLVAANAQAQAPPPGPELDLFKKDVGEWDCVIKAWSAPGAEPMITKGTETNRMFGGYWLISEFKGNMMGSDFEGRGTYGYDTKKKKYVGTWIDSMGPYMMQTEGTYDKATETLTVAGESPGPDGVSPFTYTLSTCYADGKRVLTMHMQPKGSGADQKMKLFEMTYTKKK